VLRARPCGEIIAAFGHELDQRTVRSLCCDTVAKIIDTCAEEGIVLILSPLFTRTGQEGCCANFRNQRDEASRA
jgi:hypothetical protein